MTIMTIMNMITMVASAERVPVNPWPSLPCARAILAPLRDTADCSPADVAPVTYPDLADRSPANFVTSMEECGAHVAVLSDYVGDNDVYHYDSRNSDCSGYWSCADPDDYDDYHGCYFSHRDFDDSDGCSIYGDCDGDITADVSSLDGYPGHDLIQMDVIRPQTDSDESSAALETSVVGAVDTGAGWGDCKRFHSWYRMSGDYYMDVGGGADVCGQSSFGVGRFVSIGGPRRSVGVRHS